MTKENMYMEKINETLRKEKLTMYDVANVVNLLAHTSIVLVDECVDVEYFSTTANYMTCIDDCFFAYIVEAKSVNDQCFVIHDLEIGEIKAVKCDDWIVFTTEYLGKTLKIRCRIK